jgi:hypothetical protein
MMHLKSLEKQEQAKPKICRKKEIITITGKINKIETKSTIQRFSETKSGSF